MRQVSKKTPVLLREAIPAKGNVSAGQLTIKGWEGKRRANRVSSERSPSGDEGGPKFLNKGGNKRGTRSKRKGRRQNRFKQGSVKARGG